MYKFITKERREKLSQELEDGDLLIVFGGNDELGIDQIASRDRRNHNFFYLTGMDIPGGLLLIARIRGNVQEILFIHRRTAEEEFYLGVSLDLQYYREKTGIPVVMYKEDFDDIINQFGMMMKLNKVYFASSHEKMSKYPRFENLMADKLTRAYPGIRIDSMAEKLGFMRLRKTDLEVEQIRKAAEITGHAIKEAARALHPGIMDYQLRSIIRHNLSMEGAEPDVILALLGRGTTILHNFCPQGAAKDGDLFLTDILAYYNDYCCDISRTFPVSGKFTEEQAYWYNVCLKTQELVIESLAPGKLRSECGKEGNAYLEDELRRHGYLGKTENVGMLLGRCAVNYATPGMVNHGIGLHHAEKSQDEEGRIVPGMVFTVEPGIYLGDRGIGIRIEDDILITETGYEILSKAIPKKLEEIEAMVG